MGKAWLADNPGYEWDGNWETTIPNEMSVIYVTEIIKCDCKQRSMITDPL